MKSADIGIVGLGVMGANLALNLSDKGYRLSVYDRESTAASALIAGDGRGRTIALASDPRQLLGRLGRPRVVLLMITAGRAVAELIEQLLPLLEPGDILIDGGNSNYRDSERRWRELAARGIRFVGMGVSGGEHGARHGPSLMPGGAKEAWPTVRSMFEAIAARADGEPCCRWLGDGGAGHFVKMVHNGIEYGDMQLIAEVCHLMRHGLGMAHDEIADTLAGWNGGRLESYLIDITSRILRQRDAGGAARVDKILDCAGHKGTGLWIAQEALEHGVAASVILEAVAARMLSARRPERLAAAALAERAPEAVPPAVPHGMPQAERRALVDALGEALYAGRLVCHAQGFMLMRAASERHGWALPYGGIARLWRAGCILRSRLLADIAASYARETPPPSLLLDPVFAAGLAQAQDGWRKAVMLAVGHGVAVPALASALTFFDGYRCASSAANILQAQRDLFGAHGYRRSDRGEAERFHTRWLGDGAEVRLP